MTAVGGSLVGPAPGPLWGRSEPSLDKRIMTNVFSIKQVDCVIVTDDHFFLDRTGRGRKSSRFYEPPNS